MVQEHLAQQASASRGQDEKDGYDAVFNALPVPLTHIADFVPVFCDVLGDGSCFFYSLTYTIPQSQSPASLHTTAFGPHFEHAHEIRRKAVDKIRVYITSQASRHDEFIDSAHIDTQIYDLCRGIRSEINEILTHSLGYMFSDDHDMVRKLETYQHIIDERLERMTAVAFETNHNLNMRVAQVFPFLIVSVRVPHSWVNWGPSTSYEGNMGCGIDEIGPGYDFSQTHDIPCKSIFILYTGCHYMRILFLNVDENSDKETKIIDHVDSWDRARWLEKIGMYWGFPQEWWVRFASYKNMHRCLYRVQDDDEHVCSLPLGHTSSHSFS